VRTIRLVLEYEGTGFAGWQAQRSGLRTVQGEVEAVLRQVLQEPPKLGVAGRTDAGVHARGQVASFRTENALPLWRLARALTGMLPGDVSVRSLAEVPDGFHARFSAVERRYVYRLLDRPSALWGRHAWWPWMALDADALTAAFAPCLGEHDFRAFAGREPSKEPLAHGRCNVRRLRFVRWEGGTSLEVWANRFLYHMVRNFVGTATAFTKGTRKASDLPAILASQDRRRAGPTAPPVGLTLERVIYPERWAPTGEVVDAWGRTIAEPAMTAEDA
jgi:tRNA pseudouridine38-40 synthase